MNGSKGAEYYALYNWLGKLSANTNKIYNDIIGIFGNVKDAWEESGNAMLRNTCFSSETVTEKFYSEKLREEALKQCEEALKKGMIMLTPFDENYPSLLREYSRKPLLLYCKGDVKGVNASENLIGVVGSRNCTAYGREVTKNLCSELSLYGFSIVSGFARGIDTVAHKAALGKGVFTVAVLGCGADVVYPGENRGLYNEIAERCLIISEQPPATEPFKQNFPARNRIIAGMSSGILVCEAGLGSGALITAQLANDDGRDVMAVPSNIDTASGSGCNSLLKEGAYCITSHKDILRVYGIDEKDMTQGVFDISALNDNEKAIYKYIEDKTGVCDSISEDTGLDIAKVRRILTTLEINGYITQRCDGVYYSKNRKV